MSTGTRHASRWPIRRLGDILVRHNEVVHPGERTGEGTFVGLEHIEPNSGRRIGSAMIDLASLTGRKPTFRRGQIVYGYLRPYLNKVWVAEFDGYSSVDQFAFDVRPELADTEFVAAFMRSDTFLRRSSIVTTTGQLPRIGTEQIAAVPIELPPLDVQRRIAGNLAEQLAAASVAKRAAEERVTVAASLIDAYLRDAFNQRESKLWPEVAIGELTVTCSGSTPPRGTRGYFGGAIPWVKTGELKDGLIETTEETVTELALERCALPRLPVGTLLVAMYGQGQTRGRTGLLACEATTNQACFAILPKPSVFCSEFLQFWFRANYARLRTMTENRGGNQPNLNGLLLRGLAVPMPTIAVQKQITSALSKRLAATDSLLALIRAESNATAAVSSALLRVVFNGVA